MQTVSVYRLVRDGKVKRVATFASIDALVDELAYTDRNASRFGNSFYDRVNGEKFRWDTTYTRVFEYVNIDSWILNAYVVFDHMDRLITRDRLLGMIRACRRKHKDEWWKKYWRNRLPGRKWKRHRGSHYRLVRTQQERRWHHAWDGEEFAPVARAKRGNAIPDAWDDIPRHTHKNKNWKLHRTHQWKDK